MPKLDFSTMLEVSILNRRYASITSTILHLHLPIIEHVKQSQNAENTS